MSSTAPSPDSQAPRQGGPRSFELSGRRLILHLFFLLAVATATILLALAPFAPPGYRDRVYFALAGNLCLPVVGWFLIRGFNEVRGPAWRAYWFATAMPAGLATFGACVAAMAFAGLL